MGNCFRRDSSMVWVDEDWELTATPKNRRNNNDIPEKEGLLFGNNDDYKDNYSSSDDSYCSIREIKIKITKKQLEEFVGRVDKQQVPPDQVLSRLINASQHCEVLRQRSWRPRLQSIPEVN